MSLKTQLARSLVAALMVADITPAFAHHAFSAEFDVDKFIEFKGVVSRVEWVNPHGWVYVDVKDADGKVTNWAVEFGGPNALLRRGVRKTDLPVGSEVSVSGYRAKNGKPIIAGDTVKLANGQSFYAGADNGGAPPPKDNAAPAAQPAAVPTTNK